MTIPGASIGMNINTWITVMAFILTLIAGGMAYGAFKSYTETTINEMKVSSAAENVRVQAKMTTMETGIAGMQSSINLLNIQDARRTEQIASMLSYLQRIERTLDELVKENRVP